MCAYEPTAKTPPSINLKFYDDLQDTIDRIPHNDILVMLGDFNARVGVLDTGNNLWQGVIGKHGLSERNFVGEEFLEFCALNQFSIMNTWFQKKKIYQGTWTHPATKKCHMIEFVVMRAEQRVVGRDVQVMRGANCWTDHKLVRAKLKVTVPHSAKREEKISLPFAIHKLKTPAKRDEYCEVLEQHLLARPLRAGDSTECNWDALKSCIVSAAEEVVGRGKRK